MHTSNDDTVFHSSQGGTFILGLSCSVCCLLLCLCIKMSDIIHPDDIKTKHPYA